MAVDDIGQLVVALARLRLLQRHLDADGQEAGARARPRVIVLPDEGAGRKDAAFLELAQEIGVGEPTRAAFAARAPIL